MEATLPDATITLTLHQLQRLVEGYYSLDTCSDIADVQDRVDHLAELCAENGCKECRPRP
jgi:hypothetical protein